MSQTTFKGNKTTFAQNSIGERFSVPKGIAITNLRTMTIVNSTFAENSVGFFIVAGAIFGGCTEHDAPQEHDSSCGL